MVEVVTVYGDKLVVVALQVVVGEAVEDVFWATLFY